MFKVTEVARFGNAPAFILKLKPPELHIAEETTKGEKPTEVVVMLDEGLKIPMLYNITATITMIRIAQPYVIIYSNADCDLLLFTERLG